MTRHPRRLALGLALAVGATMLVGQSADASPTLSQATAKARALRHQLGRLELQQSVAIERYDGVQDQLQQAVSSELTSGDQASAAQAQADQAQDAVADRARALYMSGGGQLGLMVSVLDGGSPGDVLERAQTVNNVIQSDDIAAAAERANAALAAGAATASSLNREQIAALQQSATTSLAQVQSLLAQQRQLLRHTNATVVRLAKQQEKAAEAAAVATAAQTGRQAGVPVGSGSSANLPATIEGPTSEATAAIAAARSKLGTPYLWGAVGPTRFDCSGLMMWSYAQAGVKLPRTSRAQYAGLPHVSLSSLEPGDLVFYATNTSNPATIHHVAMYMGNGLMINAPHTGDVVRYGPVAESGLIGAARPTL